IYHTNIFGELDYHSHNTFYNLLTAPCVVVVMSKSFRKRVRFLAWAVVICSGVNTIVSMSRAAIATLAVTGIIASIFARNKRAVLLVGSSVCLIALVYSNGSFDSFKGYFLNGLTYDTAMDQSAAGRLDSIREGWQQFLDHPMVGVGPGQNALVITATAVHELP